MSTSGVQWTGLDELIRAMTRAPEDVRRQGMAIVREETEAAQREIAVRYGRSSRSGKLARSVRAEFPSSTILIGILRSLAAHSHLFEFGTTARKTRSGANRGRMPAAHVFVPIVERHRERMYTKLLDLLRRMGFEVST